MKTIEATYEDGVFKPRTPIDLHAGVQVRVILPDTRDPSEIMAERFPRSWGAICDEDAAEMIRVIEEDCERIDPDE
jgi:predicted DNA-binding antitoxin AbrB/MazE fold protein